MNMMPMNDIVFDEKIIKSRSTCKSALNARGIAYDAELEVDVNGETYFLHGSIIFGPTEYGVSKASVMKAIQARPKVDKLDELASTYIEALHSVELLAFYDMFSAMDSPFGEYFSVIDDMLEEERMS